MAMKKARPISDGGWRMTTAARSNGLRSPLEHRDDRRRHARGLARVAVPLRLAALEHDR
ncbi:hypothetical protein BTM_5653 [Burkholderia thailandensis 34]|nr:hypothetical protein BTM_5653 [Burkholderia thailandensis 34]